MIGSAMSVATSGLRAMAKAADVHSGNIANALTEGYSRQDAGFANMQFGGVNVSSITRFSATLATRISHDQGVASQTAIKRDALGFASDTLSSASEQLSSAMTSLREALGAAADRPQESNLRISVAEGAKAMASQATINLSLIDNQVADISKQSNVIVDAASQKMKELVDLNKSASYDPSDNDIRNRQAQVGKELADLVGGELTFTQSNQATFTVNGAVLVSGISTGKLPDDVGGKLGGLKSASKDISALRDTFSNALSSFSSMMNGLNAQGLDANNNPGADLFSFDGTSLKFTASADTLALKSSAGVAGEIARKMSGNTKVSTDLADLATTAALQASTATGEASSASFGLISSTNQQADENGVNLDQEAVNLKNAQNYYAANAKVIETANAMLGTLINMKA